MQPWSPDSCVATPVVWLSEKTAIPPPPPEASLLTYRVFPSGEIAPPYGLSIARPTAHVLAPVLSLPLLVMQPAVPNFCVSRPVDGFRSKMEIPTSYWPAYACVPLGDSAMNCVSPTTRPVLHPAGAGACEMHSMSVSPPVVALREKTWIASDPPVPVTYRKRSSELIVTPLASSSVASVWQVTAPFSPGPPNLLVSAVL